MWRERWRGRAYNGSWRGKRKGGVERVKKRERVTVSIICREDLYFD